MGWVRRSCREATTHDAECRVAHDKKKSPSCCLSECLSEFFRSREKRKRKLLRGRRQLENWNYVHISHALVVLARTQIYSMHQPMNKRNGARQKHKTRCQESNVVSIIIFFLFVNPLTGLRPLQSLRRGNHARCDCSEVIKKKERTAATKDTHPSDPHV